MLTLVGVLFAVFLLISLPVAFALALAAAPAFVFGDYMPISVAVERMYGVTQSFPLLAVPFFILGGNLMNTTGITERLLRFARLLTGWMAGGLAQVAVVLSMLMGGICGSAVADASAIGSLLIPWHKRLGYPAAFSAATLAAAATIDILIPPSIPMILFALSANASIAELFVAGVLPGLLMCGGFMAACWWVGRRRNFPRETAPLDAAAFRRHLAYASPALVLPVLIIVFLRFGIATPTEVAVLSTLYAGLVSALIYRDLGWKPPG